MNISNNDCSSYSAAKNDKLIAAMTDYFSGDPKRIQHFIKVSAFAKIIASSEGVDSYAADLIYTAAIVHDIGIKAAEEKYGKGVCGGDLQQKLGIEPAKKMLKALDFNDEIIERVCFLIAHHHTYCGVNGLDWQILLEADFLVNAFEDNLPKKNIIVFRDKVFKTKTGTELLNHMYAL